MSKIEVNNYVFGGLYFWGFIYFWIAKHWFFGDALFWFYILLEKVIK